MPTYDYKCNACKHRWEMFQSMKDKPVKVCPSCGKKQAERLIGAGAALIFKGSGFYITDYRSDAYKKSAESESKSKNEGAAPAAGAAGSGGAGGAGTGSGGSSDSGAKAGDAKPSAAPAQAAAPAKPAAKSEGGSKGKKSKSGE